MPLGIIGRKVGMTQHFDENGNLIPVTLVEAGPCLVINLRTQDKHGYTAIQVGYETIRKERVTKPKLGQFPENIPPKRIVKEFRITEKEATYSVGDSINVDLFEAGEKIDVRGISKGRGFQGVIKRYNFAGGPKSHGSHFKRIPGSVGQSASPSKIWKGTKMPGKMGNKSVCIQNIEIAKVDPEKHLLAIAGSIPGPNNGVVYITKAAKKPLKKAKLI